MARDSGSVFLYSGKHSHAGPRNATEAGIALQTARAGKVVFSRIEKMQERRYSGVPFIGRMSGTGRFRSFARSQYMKTPNDRFRTEAVISLARVFSEIVLNYIPASSQHL